MLFRVHLLESSCPSGPSIGSEQLYLSEQLPPLAGLEQLPLTLRTVHRFRAVKDSEDAGKGGAN